MPACCRPVRLHPPTSLLSHRSPRPIRSSTETQYGSAVPALFPGARTFASEAGRDLGPPFRGPEVRHPERGIAHSLPFFARLVSGASGLA